MNRTSLLSLLLLTSVACSNEPDPPPDNEPRATWARDIAPLYRDRCVSCHSSGGIAPFSLEDYESAKLMANASLAAVRDRIMPPWLITDDGSCQSFSDSRWLSDAEIEKLSLWVDDGMAMGAVASAVVGDDDDTVGDDRIELTMRAPYVPEASEGHADDDYRCFLLDPGLDRDRFITAFEVIPGDVEQVHHMLVYDVDPAMVVGGGANGPITNGDVLAALDSDPNKPGWSCFGAAGEGVIPAGLPAAWAPGTSVTHYPEGTGLFLQKSHLLVMQIHYHLHHDGGSDQSTIRFGLADQVAQPGFVFLPDGFLNTAFGPEPDTLAPGMSDVPYHWTAPAGDLVRNLRDAIGSPTATVYLQGTIPHMHGRGRSMEASLTRPNTSSTCLADVFRWDFNWQRFYFYQTPIEIAEDAQLDVTCHFDTSRDTEPVLPGLGSGDEMCLFGIYVIVKP